MFILISFYKRKNIPNKILCLSLTSSGTKQITEDKSVNCLLTVILLGISSRYVNFTPTDVSHGMSLNLQSSAASMHSYVNSEDPAACLLTVCQRWEGRDRNFHAANRTVTYQDIELKCRYNLGKGP